MVDLKRVDVGSHHFIGCSLYLKAVPLHLLIFTRGFLCGSQFSIAALKHRNSVICLMEHSNSYDDLLNSKVVACSHQATLSGVLCGMSGREVLTLLHEVED